MKGPPCSVCGSIKYRKGVGVIVCSNGHQSTDFREEAGDDDYQMSSAKRTLRMRKGKLVDLTEQVESPSYIMPRILRFELFQHFLKTCVTSVVEARLASAELIVRL